MTQPDLKHLDTAYVMCTCGDACTRACVVCHSPTWEHEDCVRHLWHTIVLEPLLREDNQPLPRDVQIERLIDWMEAHGLPLLPWQAEALRIILRVR